MGKIYNDLRNKVNDPSSFMFGILATVIIGGILLGLGRYFDNSVIVLMTAILGLVGIVFKLDTEKQNTKNNRAYEERKKLYFEAFEVLVDNKVDNKVDNNVENNVESNDRHNPDEIKKIDEKIDKQLKIFNLKMKVIASDEVIKTWDEMVKKKIVDNDEIDKLINTMEECLDI